MHCLWVKHEFYPDDHTLFPIKRCALFIEGKFIYGDDRLVFIFNAANTKQWSECGLRDMQYGDNDESVLKCSSRDLFSKKAEKERKHRSMNLKIKLGFSDSDSLSIRGTQYDAKNLLWSDYIPGTKVPVSCYLQGVWVLPRYHKNQEQRR